MDLENLRSVEPVQGAEIHTIPFLTLTVNQSDVTVCLVVAKYNDKYYVTHDSIANILDYTPQNVWHHLKKYTAILNRCFPIILPSAITGKKEKRVWLIPYLEVSKLLECFTAPANVSSNEAKKQALSQKRRTEGKEYLQQNLVKVIEEYFSINKVHGKVTADIPDIGNVEDVIGKSEVVAAKEPQPEPKELTPMEKLRKATMFDLAVVECLDEVHKKIDALKDENETIYDLMQNMVNTISSVAEAMHDNMKKLQDRNEETIKNLQFALVYDKFTPTPVPKGEIGSDGYPINYNISSNDLGKQLKLFSKTGNVHPDVAKYLLLINNIIKSGARDDDQGKPYVFKRRIINRWKDESTVTGFKYEEGYELIYSQHGPLLIKNLLLEMIKTPGMVDYDYDPITDKFKYVTLNFRKYAAYKNYKGTAKIDDCHMNPKTCDRLLSAIRALHKKNSKILATETGKN